MFSLMFPHMYPSLVLLVLIVPFANPLFAQPVFKCTVNGVRTYGDQPCSGVPSAELHVPAAPAPDPIAARELQRDKRLLASLQKERHQREAVAEREAARARRAAAVQGRRCAKLRLHQRWAEEDLARAGVKQQAAAGTRAQRHRQEMALECPG